jgi:hypothetical protein
MNLIRALHRNLIRALHRNLMPHPGRLCSAKEGCLARVPIPLVA